MLTLSDSLSSTSPSKSLSFSSSSLASSTSFCSSPSLMSWITSPRTAAEESGPQDYKNSSSPSLPPLLFPRLFSLHYAPPPLHTQPPLLPPAVVSSSHACSATSGVLVRAKLRTLGGWPRWRLHSRGAQAVPTPLVVVTRAGVSPCSLCHFSLPELRARRRWFEHEGRNEVQHEKNNHGTSRRASPAEPGWQLGCWRRHRMRRPVS